MKTGDIVRLTSGKKPILVVAAVEGYANGRYLTSNEQGVWPFNRLVKYQKALTKKEQDAYTRISKGLL